MKYLPLQSIIQLLCTVNLSFFESVRLRSQILNKNNLVSRLTASNSLIQNTSLNSTFTTTTLSFLYQNVRGLNSKFDSFSNNLLSCVDEVDVLILTETWLHEDVANSELFPDNYCIFRCDRKYKHLGVVRGGGVLIAINNKFSCCTVDVSNITNAIPSIDFVGIEIFLSNYLHFFIFTVYIPPSVSITDYVDFFDLVSSLDQIHNNLVLFVGDFNTPKFGSELNNNFSHCLNNFVSFCGFCQYNHILNNYDSLLDLIFSTFPCTVLRSDFFLVPEVIEFFIRSILQKFHLQIYM